MRALWMLVVVFVGFGSFPQASAVEREGVTPFETRGQGSIILRVLLNGRGPYRFLLDTGSTHTAVSEKTAVAIGAPVVAKTVIGSAAGSRETLVVRIDTLDVGPITRQVCWRRSWSLRASPAWTVSSVTTRCDAPLHDRLPPAPCRVVAERRSGGAWNYAETAVEPRALPDIASSTAIPLRLVPDTGAESLLLFDPDRTLPVTQLPSLATLTTMSAETAGPAGACSNAAHRPPDPSRRSSRGRRA